MQDRFLEKLEKGSYILDFGCGSGRDTKYFLEQGYRVEAVDGSDELCKRASQYTGIQVKQMFFEELSAVDKYDGIWACSSILHLPIDQLAEVVQKMAAALRGGEKTGSSIHPLNMGTFPVKETEDFLLI